MTGPAEQQGYRVLARKYRPGRFEELIGQEALVRTLKNAIESKRLAHAFILTGVRGIGKTTTARLIARALNCTGNGNTGPTITPCGTCESCLSIAQSRGIDVLEIDAASHTGVDDIREITDAARYAPTASRNKIYIIDEVHMLSRSAFNALLKTLEEPPDHVTFIFATTEIRKVSVTVLSRCQRFDLPRVDSKTLLAHLTTIAEKEGASVEMEALRLIVRAAEGSVRDGLSLLDQAIAHGAGTVSLERVNDMLGLADQVRVFELFDSLMAGDVVAALDNLGEQYRRGADPLAVLRDLLEITHWITRLKATPALDDIAIPEAQRKKGAEIAARLTMPHLSRAWQMLLKGLEEVRQAPSPLAATEMALLRLAYSADLPTPDKMIRDLREKGTPQAAPEQPAPAPAPSPGPAATAQDHWQPHSFEDVVARAGAEQEGILYAHLMENVHAVGFEEGRLEISLGNKAPDSLPNKLATLLRQWSGKPWIVSLAAPGSDTPTLAEARRNQAESRLEAARRDPLVREILETFPGATLESVDAPAPDHSDSRQLLNDRDQVNS